MEDIDTPTSTNYYNLGNDYRFTPPILGAKAMTE